MTKNSLPTRPPAFRRAGLSETVENRFMPESMASSSTLVVVFLALAGMSGCAQEPEIRTYLVPREAENKPFRPVADGPDDKVRMLAAVIPVNEQNSWFVRFLAAIEKVADREKDFDAFLNSIRVTGMPATPLTWTVPEGWRIGPPNPNRVVTLQYGAGDKLLEMYISKPFGGNLSDNVNRWRTDFVGLKKLDDEDLATTLIPVQLGGTAAYKVDLRGPGGAKAGGGMGRPPGSTN